MIEQYFTALGGGIFPEETKNRSIRFFEELEAKRRYEKFTTFKSSIDEMIVINGIKVFSFCEHHLLPFFGYCSIGYIPNGDIFGLSKFQRLVDKVASKPTLQESITDEIATEIYARLTPKGLGVAMSCVHTCMYGRGINTSTISVNSQVLKGIIKDTPEARSEFLSRIKIENFLR